MNRWKNMTPFRTALTYAVFSALWTSFSDDALEFLVPRYSLNYDLMNTLNDWLFVFASAVLVYFMLRSELKSLHASEEKFKYIFDYSAVGKTITSPDGVITANKAFREMLGYSEEELVGEKWQEITYPDDIAPSMQVSEMLIKGEKNSAQFTKRYLHKNGSVVWVNLNTSLRRNEAGEPMYFMTSVMDITERKLTEEHIQDLLEFNEKILKTAPIGILIYKLSGACVFANQNAALITGATVEKLEAQNFHALESWKASGLYQLVEQATAGKVCVTSDVHHFSTFGKDVWLTVRAIIFKSKHEDQLLLTISDITERKQAEEALQKSELIFRSFLEQSVDAILIANNKGEVIQWSKGAEQLTGFSPEETVGRLIWDVQFRSAPEEYKSTENYEHLKATLQEVFSTGKAKILNHFGEAVLRRPDGSYVTAQTLAFSIQTGHEFLLGNIMRDITEHKHAEKIIHQYATELEQRVKDRTAELTYANHVKDEFLANMSHELRTPLNSILGLSETLLEQRRGSLNESQQRSLQTIEASGSHLLNLINDILDLSKVDAGKFDYYPQSLSLNEVCRSSLSFVRDQAAKKSINLQYTNEASVPSIYADPRRLKQILVNLLTNAVKFTPAHGQVTLEVHAQVEHKLIQISIIDTGIGIAAEDLKRLFTPFVQLDSSLNRQFEGTGLGLALAQKLTDLHGGSLEVESEVGKGSRFTVNLMMYEFGPEEQLLNAQVDGPRKVNQPVIRADSLSNHVELKNKILLAEDNEANILTVSEYLESHGYQILVAHDGVEAIAKAEADNPDLILMDVQMPNMNGLEATRRLRADPRFTATPIVALTALAMVGDRERCLEAGATEYLSKPVSLQALRQMIEAFLIQKMKMKLKLP